MVIVAGFFLSYINLFFRSILEHYQFSPLKDLEKNNKTGLIRLTDQRRLKPTDTTKRIVSFEQSIMSYFRSRNEDSIKKPILAINTSLKSKISSHDVVRPSYSLPKYHQTPWTTDMNQTQNSDYSHLQDARSGYPSNEKSSLSVNAHNDSYYRNHHYAGQLIYYDDENGNECFLSPGEISF
jgi:hypothetical protein